MIASQRSNSVPGSATFSCKSLLFFITKFFFVLFSLFFLFRLNPFPTSFLVGFPIKNFRDFKAVIYKFALCSAVSIPYLALFQQTPLQYILEIYFCFFASNPNKIYSESILQINGKRLVKETVENGAFFYLNSSWKPHIDCINNQCEGSTRPPLALPLISKSEKGQKDSFLNGDSERDLCDVGEVLCQLSYQAN